MAFCSQCGTTLPENARFCPKCGEAVTAEAAPAQAPSAVVQPGPGLVPVQAVHPSSRPGRGGLILPVILVLALVIIGVALWSQRDGARPIAGGNATETAERADEADTSEAPAETQAAPEQASSTASSLDSAFITDPQAARARYDGPVTVSGTVATMVTPGPTPALSLEGRTKFNYVVANFPSGAREQLARVAKGDRVTLACRSVTAIAGTTMLQGCALE